MIVYSDNKAGFCSDVALNKIAERVEAAVQARLGRRTSKSERASWENSLQYMRNAIQDPEIPDTTGVAIEYRIPASAKRIDFLLTGQDAGGADTVVIVELKQWSEVAESPLTDMVKTGLGGGMQDVTHPSYQAWSYASLLSDFNEEVYSHRVGLRPCAYLHNCSSGEVLRAPRYEAWTSKVPVFLRQDVTKLTSFIKEHVRSGDDGALLYRIDKGRIRPSKQLADHLQSLLEGNQAFVLIDEQKLVYETCLDRMRRAQREGARKQVVLVEGGPGTGKSVVAVNLLGELLGKSELNAAYVTRNAAPRAVYESKLTGSMRKSRISSLFQSSGKFMSTDADAYDVLIVDEAHRLTEKSGFYGNEGDNQISEIIRSARGSVFFVDDRQRVTLKDIGTKAEIDRLAKEEGAEIIHLKLASQFRCNGSDSYLAWLDNALQIEETAHEDLEGVDFDFRVLDSPNKLRELIRERNLGRNRSRMVAGYCWPWASKKDPGAIDVDIPEHNFGMQWNLTQDGSLWILARGSVEQIGCIHTCQGLELDYVGVIIGEDFIVRGGAVVTDGNSRARQDASVKGLKKLQKADPDAAQRQADSIIKNTYRTLMSRGMKGCYIFCVDPETNAWFRHAAGRLSEPTTAEPQGRSAELRDLSLTVLSPEEAQGRPNAVPLYDLAVAAGHFSGEQVAEDPVWVELPEDFRGGSDRFVAQVVGESMNRRVPNGSYCLFKARPAGTREGRLTLVQHRELSDPELGGRFTLKIYGSEVVRTADGTSRKRVVLRPDSTESHFAPIVLETKEDDEFQVLAELVAVIQ